MYTLSTTARRIGPACPSQQFPSSDHRDVQTAEVQHHLADNLPIILQVGRADICIKEKTHSETSGRPSLRCWRFHSR